jgi:N-acetylmuramoyl-L-alanine amidase
MTWLVTIVLAVVFLGAAVAVLAATRGATPAPMDDGAASTTAATAAPSPSTASSTATTSPAPLAGRVVVLDPGHNRDNGRFAAEINRPVDAGGFQKAGNTTGTATDAGLPEATINEVFSPRSAVE